MIVLQVMRYHCVWLHVYMRDRLYYRSYAITVCSSVHVHIHTELCDCLHYRSCAITVCGFCMSCMGLSALGGRVGWLSFTDCEELYIQLRLVVQKLQHV